MAGRWLLINGKHNARDLYMGDIVRTRRYYDGEDFEVESNDGWDDGMPEIVERWYVEDISRNGWITLAQERREDWGKDVLGNQRWSGLFEETGVRVKVRRNARLSLMLAVAPSDYGDRWARFGLEGTSPRPKDHRLPVRRG